MSEETTQSQLAEEFIITDLETLKVMADPMRISIIEYLMKPATVKQIAHQIDRPPTKLYYHFNLLEKHNLIRTVDTRIVSGIVEKHYQAVAKNYRVQRDLLSAETDGTGAAREGIETVLSNMWNDTHTDISASLNAGLIGSSEEAPPHKRLVASQGMLKLKPEQAKAFYERLMALLNEYDDQSNQNESDDGYLNYRIFLTLYPSARGQDKSKGTKTEEE